MKERDCSSLSGSSNLVGGRIGTLYDKVEYKYRGSPGGGGQG